jgi:octaprenyl-diphosphate synthase
MTGSALDVAVRMDEGGRALSAEPEGALLLASAVALVQGDLEAAERELAGLVRSPITPIPDVAGHLAFAGGKRFRPLLALLCARAAGYDAPARITIAAVGELLHTATLLHDDVVDFGEFRRGRPAARVAFGNGIAVLTGDYCLARALGAVAATGNVRAVQSMSEAVTRMAEGEVAQLHAAGDPSLDRERYASVIDRKTAALIAWCSSVAGLVDEPYVAPLQLYGREVGFAFQMADDVIDCRAELEERGGPAGKESGQDLRDGKLTLPVILACEADERLHARVRAALRAGPPMSEATARAILDAVRATDAIARTTAIALEHAARAQRALSALPPSPARAALSAVADYVVRRST